MKTLVIYHSSDFDGVMSCLICRKYLLNLSQHNLKMDIDLFGWNYGDIIPDKIDRIRKMNIDEMNDIISKIDFDNICYIKCLGKES